MTCLWDEVLYLPLFSLGATWLATENVLFFGLLKFCMLKKEHLPNRKQTEVRFCSGQWAREGLKGLFWDICMCQMDPDEFECRFTNVRFSKLWPQKVHFHSILPSFSPSFAT
jgi:hypothetical protein